MESEAEVLTSETPFLSEDSTTAIATSVELALTTTASVAAALSSSAVATLNASVSVALVQEIRCVVNASEPITATEIFVKIHGVLMVIAWTVLLPVSMLILDNFNHTIPKKLYFQIYRPMRLIGIVVALVSFVMIIAKFETSTLQRNFQHFVIGTVIISVMLLNALLIYIYQRRRHRGVPMSKLDSFLKPVNMILTIGNDILAKREMMGGFDIMAYPKWVSGCIMLAAIVHTVILITLKVHQLVWTPKTVRGSLISRIMKFNIVEDDSELASNLNMTAVESPMDNALTSTMIANGNESRLKQQNSVELVEGTGETNVREREAEVMIRPISKRWSDISHSDSHHVRYRSPRRQLSQVTSTSTVEVLLYNKFRIFLLHFHATVMLVFTTAVVTGLITFGMYLGTS